MLQQFEQTRQRFGGRHALIDSWLSARKELLVRYCKLSGLPSIGDETIDDRALPTREAVSEFCAMLMDYVSTGHFEVYERLIGSLEEGAQDAVRASAGRLYAQIVDSTDTVLAFDEAYGDGDAEELWPEFDVSLSRLGEALETRFEREDELIALFDAEPAAVAAG